MLLRMARTEGVRSLWRGLDAAVLLNLPLIAIYLPCYDYLESKCSAAGLAMYGPLLSGKHTLKDLSDMYGVFMSYQCFVPWLVCPNGC